MTTQREKIDAHKARMSGGKAEAEKPSEQRKKIDAHKDRMRAAQPKRAGK